MATENRWRAWKIHEELSKLGIHVDRSTISRYLPKATPDPDNQQRWTTFLRNHRDMITGMDFFVVPTVRFRLLYVVLGEKHPRRLLREYIGYYNAERVHTSIGDAPEGREPETRPSPGAKVVALSRVGGLHHRYTWREAA
jgi:hypothetical protein